MNVSNGDGGMHWRSAIQSTCTKTGIRFNWLAAYFYIKTNATVDTAVAPKTAYPAPYAPLRDKTSKTT
jgi:hypothetical protein